MRGLGRATVSALQGFSTGVVVAVIAPAAFGWSSFTVMSGSMEPAIATGDVVVNERIAPLDARIGDVVTFVDTEDPSRLITHRLETVQAHGDTVDMVTRGDANTGVEKWSVAVDGRIGRVVYRVPLLGYVLAWARTLHGRLLLVAVPATLLAAKLLVRIWRPRDAVGEGVSAGADV